MVGQCSWCQDSDVELTDDHVFPHFLGGTKDLTVPSCPGCQATISVAEQYVARRSHFALYRVLHGPGPRHKGRPESGVVEADYSLVWNESLGCFGEVAFRAGQEYPASLAYIEIDPASLIARRGGRSPGDVDRLLDRLDDLLKQPPKEGGLLCQIRVTLFADGDPLASDQRFHPRIVLDHRDSLFIRARNPDEATRFMHVLMQVREHPFLRDNTRWVSGEIKGGTPHLVTFTVDRATVLRIATKIACGLALSAPGFRSATVGAFARARGFVLGRQTDDPPARELTAPGGFQEWPDYHLVVVEPYAGRVRAIVALYGECFLVDLGDCAEFSAPEVAICARDGSGVRILTGKEADEIRALLNRSLDAGNAELSQ
jgi:hypothetical protein